VLKPPGEGLPADCSVEGAASSHLDTSNPEWDIPMDSHKSHVMDSDRIFVWRNNDWHPISSNQAHQINTALARGETVFDINDGPYVWTIDTTGKDGWVQISQHTKRRRAMRRQASACPPNPNMSLFLTVPTRSFNSSLGSARKVPSVRKKEEPSLVSSLREEWESLLSNTVGRGQKSLSKRDLINAWVTSSGTTGLEYKDLIEQSIADIFLKMDLTRTSRIDSVEWLHYWLLENQAPSFHALVQVNEKLQTWLTQEPEVLSELLKLFLSNCRTSDDAQLTASEMRLAASTWSTVSAQNRRASVPENPVRSQSAKYLQELLLSKGKLDEDEMLSYYDYMNHMLGRRKAKVQLYQYDLSKGGAKWISPLLVGQQLGGIWHTSIVVHGKEYYYGGAIYEAEPGSTAFGAPDKIVDLPEDTMRTNEDFRTFLGRVLAHDYTVATYDVLNHNCNHFSDACCLFLLNRHIPDEILMQSEMVKRQDGNWGMQILRPILNRLFNPENGSRTLSCDDTSDADVWAKIGENLLCVWEHNEGWTRIARVVSKGEESCNLIWLDVHSGELHSQFDVSKSSVQELPDTDPKRGRPRRSSDPNIGGTFGARFHMMGA